MAKFVVVFSLLSLAVALSSGSSGDCEPGWISFLDSCYYVETFQRYTYAKAKQLCKRSGATLVSIDDADENDFLNAFTRGKLNMWIGLNDLQKEGDFQWEAEIDLDYTNWAPGQPSNYKMSQHCAQLMPNPLGKWKDVQCSKIMGYVCEKQHQCITTPVGVESGAIPNSQITASSSYAANHISYQGRLNWCQSGYSCSWCAKTNTVGQWLQVDLGYPRKVTQVATQGRTDYPQWVKTYKLCYSDDGTHCTFVTDPAGKAKTFAGNSDRTTIVYQKLTEDQMFTARFVRFVVQSWQAHISMRVEVYACE